MIQLFSEANKFLINLVRGGLKGSFEDESVRKTVVINLFNLVGLFLLTVFFIKSIEDGKKLHSIILIITDLLVLFNAIYFRITKNYDKAGIFMVVLLLILELYFLIATTQNDDLYLWYYVYPALSLFSLNSKKGSIFTGILLSITILLFYLQPEYMFDYSTNFKIRFISTNLGLFFMAYVFERVREKNYQSLIKVNDKKSYFLFKVLEQKKEILIQTKQLELTNKELEKLSLVAEKTDNAVAIMDAKGKMEWTNEGFYRMYGYGLKQIKDKNPKKLVGSNSNLKIVDLISVWFGDKKPITYEALNTTKSGNKIWAQTTLTPILGEDGRIIKLISIDSDITALKKVQKEIEEINKDITASLQYAKRIQDALLPTEQNLQVQFSNSFIFFRPKQYVSGDFYWITEQNNLDIIVAADCTGHGVPGALMSMFGISFLNKIVNEKNITEPNQILNRLRTNIINSFAKSDQEQITYDGMDVSVISINKKTNILKFAGAMNPLYIIRNNEIIEFKADRMPVGHHEFLDVPFRQKSFSLINNDVIYMFTDGFVDQFGGEKGKKFKYSRFRELLIKICNKELSEQKEILENTIADWMDKREQIDDILIIGIKYSI